jgi:acetyl-CoA synthetase
MTDMTRPAGAPGGSFYEEARRSFRWEIPEAFNIGVDVTDKWARIDPDRVAIIEWRAGQLTRTTFGILSAQSNRLANLLAASGVGKGDRVAVLASQRVETTIAHAAIYKTGAVAVPLFTLFGLDALRHRLSDSGTRSVIADADGRAKIDAIRGDLPALEQVLCLDAEDGRPAFEGLLAGYSAVFEAVDTAADDPALIIYTSGTTGASKGALHAHRVLLGHLPGVEMSHGGFPEPGDVMWTPADWAWIGGLLDVLLPALHHGVPVVACRFDKFDPAAAFQLMADCGVRNVFLPPTALKMLRQEPRPRERWRLSLRSVASGGESLGGELLAWGHDELGVAINEFYGQTECNVIVSSCVPWFPARPGAIGKPVPGHEVAIVGEAGEILPTGHEGDIAVRAPDPVMFLGYWRHEAATRDKFRGDWLITGDRGIADADGFIHFLGREDDVITSAGYRIGPGEIEDCLLKHPAVASAGVVGVPDPARTEVVTAFVVLRPGHAPSAELRSELQGHVRSRLGAHQYPRAVHFIDALPATVTGKIVRRELRAQAAGINAEAGG